MIQLSFSLSCCHTKVKAHSDQLFIHSRRDNSLMYAFLNIYVICKQPHEGFEFRLLCPLPMTVTMTPYSNGFKYNKWLNISIWPMDWTLTGTTTLGVSDPGSNGYKEVLHISQTPGLEVLWRRSNCVAISVYCKPLHIWIEVLVAAERM